MRAAITGASGFTGRYLAREALRHGAEVVGLGRNTGGVPGVRYRAADLSVLGSVVEALADVVPEVIFHLAAQTPGNTPTSDEQSWLTSNPVMTLNLLEAVRRTCPQARVVLVSSSAIYGHVAEKDLPIAEHYPIQPTTLYGVSKATQELLAIRSGAEHGLAVIRARPFNQLGPDEPPGMLTSMLASQIIAIRAGRQPPVVHMRHRATRRDFTDIRDTARAYWMLAERGMPGAVYNVCSGVATPIGSVVNQMLAVAGVEATIEESGGAPRAGDILTQSGDRRAIGAAVGWKPEINLTTSLADLLAAVAA